MQQMPMYQPPIYQQPVYQPPTQYTKNEKMKTSAITLFIIGFGLHVIGGIMTIFVVFDCIAIPIVLLGFSLYVAGFVCLCLI